MPAPCSRSPTRSTCSGWSLPRSVSCVYPVGTGGAGRPGSPAARRRRAGQRPAPGQHACWCWARSSQGRAPGWDAFVYVVYPVTDVLLAGLAVLLLLRSSGERHGDLALLALTFATWTVADNGYALLSVRGRTTSGTVVDVAYVVAPALLGLAALTRLRDGARASGPCSGTSPARSRRSCPDVGVTGSPRRVRRDAALHGRTEWVLAATVLVLTGVASGGPHHRQPAPAHTAWRCASPSAPRTSRTSPRGTSASWTRWARASSASTSHVRISLVNPAAATLLGWEVEDLLGKDACRTLCTEEHEECLISLVMALGEVVTQSARTYRRRDGSEFPVEVTAAPKDGPDRHRRRRRRVPGHHRAHRARRDEAAVRQRRQPRAADAAHGDPRLAGDAGRRRHRRAARPRPRTSWTWPPGGPSG